MALCRTRMGFPTPLWTLPLLALALGPAMATAHMLTFDGEIWCHDDQGQLDGVVDHKDLERLLKAWGTCRTPDCPADINGNGTVGRLDLISALSHFGPCHCAGDLDNDGYWTAADAARFATIRAQNPPCETDINRSGEIDGLDYHLETLSWTNDPDSDPRADLDGDGSLSILDVEHVYLSIGEDDCRADIDGNGTVDGVDFELLEHLIEDHSSECPYPVD